MNLCWLIPNDQGGGVASVALSCCRQAAAAGHDTTLLLGRPSTGHHAEHVTFRVASLGLERHDPRTPRRLVEWLQEHPQDALFFNDCSTARTAIPHVPQETRSVYVVHDTAAQYWKAAVQHEQSLDAAVAVSETVACQFRNRLEAPEKLHVLHNGTVLPPPPETSSARGGDLVFMGGSKPVKGAHDVLAVWKELVDTGFAGRLHWFGRLDDAFRERIRDLPQSERVVVHGRVPRSQIFEQAARAKVLLMLSRVEPFGMATIEAMGMGALPVAWDVDTGTQEIAEAGRTGFFAPLGDTKRLAEQVRTARRRHGELHGEAMRHARTRFSEEAMWQRYARFLDWLMDAPAVRRPKAGKTPPDYEPPTRYFQLLPDALRQRIRSFVGRSPRLGHWLRDWRGY